MARVSRAAEAPERDYKAKEVKRDRGGLKGEENERGRERKRGLERDREREVGTKKDA